MRTLSRRGNGRRSVLWATDTLPRAGAAPEAVADAVHYPATYVAGVYNRVGAEVDGRTVENESLINVPNWLCLSVRAEGGQWLGDEGNEILSHHQHLEMYRGLLVNAYTNLMAVWCLCRAAEVLETLPPAFAREVTDRLGIDRPELDRWDHISRRMRVCFHEDVISQSEGYELLEELDWDHYRATYGEIDRLDRILEAEGDSPDRYKLANKLTS